MAKIVRSRTTRSKDDPLYNKYNQSKDNTNDGGLSKSYHESQGGTSETLPPPSGGTQRDYKYLKIGRRLDEDEKDGIELMKKLTSDKLSRLTSKDISPGNLVYFKYNAKYADELPYWDKTPMSLFIDSNHSQQHILGLNFHLVPKPIRNTLVAAIMKIGKHQIRQGKPLKISYKDVKNLLPRIGASTVIRLYIKSRISKQGIVIPPEYFLKAVSTPTESIVGMPQDKVYRDAIAYAKRAKKKKGSRIGRRKK